MARINLSQYQFTLRDPYKAGHVMTALEASILNYHRADLIRKITTRWMTEIEINSPDHVLEIEELDRLISAVKSLDETYQFSPRVDPRPPAFDKALADVAYEEITKVAPAHLMPDYENQMEAAMRDPVNREKARRRLLATMKSVYGD